MTHHKDTSKELNPKTSFGKKLQTFIKHKRGI